MDRLIRYLWGFFLFSFPFSFRFLAYSDAAYRYGNFNPFVSAFAYLPEILLGAVFVLWIVNRFFRGETHFNAFLHNAFSDRSKWLWVFFGLFVVNAYFVTLFVGNGVLGAFFVLRVFEAFAVWLLLTDGVLQIKSVVTILLFGALFQILLGYAQYRLNGSVGLWFLGESYIGPDVLNVAKTDLADGAKRIRVYGTFLHPNIMAGYLLAVFFVAFKYLKKSSWLLWTAVFAWGIYLTGSQAGVAAGVFGLLVYFLFFFMRTETSRRGAVFFFGLVLVLGNLWFLKNSHLLHSSDISWQARLDQNVISRNMFLDQPFGVGVGDFTLEMEKYSINKLQPWEFQPVHNAYFLILNETGSQGIALFLCFMAMLFWLYWKKASPISLFALLFIALFDHYLWDSFAGFMITGVAAGVFTSENR